MRRRDSGASGEEIPFDVMRHRWPRHSQYCREMGRNRDWTVTELCRFARPVWST